MQNLNRFFAARIVLTVVSLLSVQATVVRGAEVLLPEGKPLVVAHYMTWFGLPETSGDWGLWRFSVDNVSADHHHYPDLLFLDGRRDIAAVDYPVIGPYDSADPKLAEYHILLARQAGIDAFMVNWYGFMDEYGERRQTDKGFAQLLKTAEQLGFKVCLNYDNKASFPPYTRVTSRAQAVAFTKKVFQEIMQKYGSSPAYLKIGGRPVISNFGIDYVYSDSLQEKSFSAREWKQILASPVPEAFFIHDHQWDWRKSIEEAGFLSIADAVFNWIGDPAEQTRFLEESKKLLADGKIKMITAMANPGFDNSACWGWGGGIQDIPRRDGQEYRDHFERALKYHPGFIQLVTWNDFTEGSTIEPTEEYGDLYLRITAEYANKLAGGNVYGKDFDVPKAIYNLRSKQGRLEASQQVSSEALKRLKSALQNAVKACNELHLEDSKKWVDAAQKLVSQEEAKLPVEKHLEATLRADKIRSFGGETTTLTLHIKNPYSRSLPLYVELDRYIIPRSWVGDVEKSLWLEPNAETDLTFPVHVPPNAGSIVGWFSATVDSPYKPIVSNASFFRTFQTYLHANVGPVNILHTDRPETLMLSIESQRKFPEPVAISFKAPDGWKVKPEKITSELPVDGRANVPFTLEIPAGTKSDGLLQIFLAAKEKTYKIQELFGTLAGSTKILQADVNQDGVADYVLANEEIEVLCTRAIGGRILQLVNRRTGNSQLFLDYPQIARTRGTTWDKWVEYGGINDWCPGDWPGTVWNNDWEAELADQTAQRSAIRMHTMTPDEIFVQREMSVAAGSSKFSVKYEIQNQGAIPKEVYWTNHPDLSPGGKAGPEDVVIVPVAQGTDGLARQAFSSRLQKSDYVPNEGWVLAYDAKSGEYVAELFDAKRIEKAGVWEGKKFFTIELVFKKILLQPGEKTTFVIEYLVGKDALDAVITKLRHQTSVEPPKDKAAPGKHSGLPSSSFSEKN